MSVDVALRLVEDRNISRNWSPTARPVGLRLQLEGTSLGAALTVPLDGNAALTNGPSLLLALSVKLTSTRTFLPTSLSVNV